MAKKIKKEKGKGEVIWLMITKPDGEIFAVRVDRIISLEDTSAGTIVMYDSRVGATVVSAENSAAALLNTITEDM